MEYFAFVGRGVQNPQPRINCESWTFERGPGEVFATEIEGMWREYLIFLFLDAPASLDFKLSVSW